MVLATVSARFAGQGNPYGNVTMQRVSQQGHWSNLASVPTTAGHRHILPFEIADQPICALAVRAYR